jgi:hypothetical protein
MIKKMGAIRIRKIKTLNIQILLAIFCPFVTVYRHIFYNLTRSILACPTHAYLCSLKLSQKTRQRSKATRFQVAIILRINELPKYRYQQEAFFAS